MKIDLAAINWLAVGVACLATFFLGAIWYMALFGKLWQRLHGFTPEKVKEMQAAKPPHIFFGGMIGSYLILSIAVAVMVTSFGIASTKSGATLGFFLWLGPAVAIGITSWLASDKKFGIYIIDLAYQLVFLVMTGAILGGWR